MNYLKNIIKKFVPQKMKIRYRTIQEKRVLKNSYRYDYQKFFGAISSNTETQIESQLMFASHSIEKGLSHENFRSNFGENALIKLSNSLENYNRLGFSKSSTRYKIALSSLKNYKLYHEEQGIEPIHLKDIFSDDILNEVEQSNENLSGTVVLEKIDKKESRKKNFYEISQERTSIREFSDAEIDMRTIESALSISMKTPTVCNRQPNRVYVVKNKKVMEKVLEIQGGYKGYKLPAILILVSTDNRAFVSINERNEGFIDGGLFSMSLLYALEYEGLGACALNAMMNHDKEQEIKRILNVSEFENLIMFIAVGQIPDKGVKCPKSQRDTYQKIMRVIE